MNYAKRLMTSGQGLSTVPTFDENQFPSTHPDIWDSFMFREETFGWNNGMSQRFTALQDFKTNCRHITVDSPFLSKHLHRKCIHGDTPDLWSQTTHVIHV